jgi:glycosyltransferase involved in cell wall biosynthesis
MLVSILTPTRNRAYILKKIFNSLCLQSLKDFEWVVVDDGSQDKTEQLLKGFIAEGQVNINYIRQQNGGKHRAINRGVQEAKGKLIFIVDSDDYLTEDALKILAEQYKFIENDSCFAGLSGCRKYPDGKRIGGEANFDVLECSPIDLRMKYHVTGDMAEVWKTSVLKQYPFPEFDGEKFCPEALVWNRIAQNYKVRYFNKSIYVCDYLPDGLTAKITKLRMDSCHASMTYYSELFSYQIPFSQKLKAAINFWRFASCSENPFREKIKKIGLSSLICWFPGYIMHIRDCKKQLPN